MPPRARKRGTAASSSSTVSSLLSRLNVSQAVLDACPPGNIQLEFGAIKKCYFKAVLEHHPDKGGDEETFREVQAAFEVLRELVDTQAVTTFKTGGSKSTAKLFSSKKVDISKATAHTPSWEFYAEAAADDTTMPTFRVEPAKTGRSTCQVQKVFIPKGALRVGRWDDVNASGYGFWCQLSHWRIPSKVWAAFPDAELGPKKPKKKGEAADGDSEGDEEELDAESYASAVDSLREVLLDGFGELSEPQQSEFVSHCMNRYNWARKVNRKPKEEDSSAKKAGPGSPKNKLATGAPVVIPQVAAARAAARSKEMAKAGVGEDEAKNALVAAKEKFKIPVPGVDGVADCLKGETVVLTGLFPEVGGGSGLNLGKDRTTAMLASFGAKVTGSVSGKTTVLLVGKEPGMSKVSKGRENKATRLMDLREMVEAIRSGGLTQVEEKPMVIESFSAGFGFRSGRQNGLALEASAEELAIAAGIVEVEEDMAALPAPSKKKKPAPAKKRKAKDTDAAPDVDDMLPPSLLAPPPPPPGKKKLALPPPPAPPPPPPPKRKRVKAMTA